MGNTRQLTDHGQPIFPITHVSLVKGMENRALMDATYAWDGTGTPDVTKIPAGVTVTYDGNTYTGTLAASASTTGRFYLVPSTTVTGEWDRYMTDGTGSSYAWKAAGTTAIPSPNVVASLASTSDSDALAASQGKILNDELSQLEAELAGTIIDQDYEVDTNAKRTKNYTIASGTRIVIKVTKTGGTGTSYNAYWIKSGGNETIFTGKDYGYVSDVLTVPNDSTGVQIFMTGVASGNTRNVKIYDASLPAYLTETDPKLVARVDALEPKVSTLEGKAVNFTGTDGVNAGTAGFVPAPATTDANKVLSGNGTWKEIHETIEKFVSTQETVANNSQRNKYYDITPGQKVVVRVSKVSGDSTTYNAYWYDGENGTNFALGVPVGTFTDVFTAPAGTTKLHIFLAKSGADMVYQVDVYNAEEGLYYVDELKQVDTLPKVKKYTPAVITADLEVSSSDQYVLAPGNPDDKHRSGEIYAYINSMSARLVPDGDIYFYFTDNSHYSIFARELFIKPVKISDDKTISYITVKANRVAEAGSISLSLYDVPQQVQDYSRPLKGAKIMCFGDSLTQFRNSNEPNRYTDYLQMLSLADVFNAGVGGTRFAQRDTPSLTPSGNQQCVAAFDICNLVIAWATKNYTYQDAAIASGLLTEEQQPIYEAKIAVLKNNPVDGFDIVTIFGGTNDYTGGSSIGTASQSTTDKGTVYGAVNSMVSALLTAKPELKIYFFSPLIRMFESTVSLATSSDVYVHTNAPDGKTLPQFIEVIQDAVIKNHCPYCDMYWSLGFNVYNFTTYFGSDYSHPYKGFQIVAEKIYKYLLSE